MTIQYLLFNIYLFIEEYLSFVKIYVYKIFVKIYYLRRPVHI